MATAYFLTDIAEPANQNRSERLQNMILLFRALGYECRSHGTDAVDKSRAENLETQMNAKNGRQATYSDAVIPYLKGLPKGDLIIATEPWHSIIFRGLLVLNQGRFDNTPVVEMWVDYPNSFATYRVFNSYFALAVAAGQTNSLNHDPNWIMAPPYIPIGPIQSGGYASADSLPCGVAHLGAMAQGVPVIAPDWGAWRETIRHGETGLLYRTEEGRLYCTGEIEQLDREVVRSYVKTYCSLDAATMGLKQYLERVHRG
jgi:hypothetical protein